MILSALVMFTIAPGPMLGAIEQFQDQAGITTALYKFDLVHAEAEWSPGVTCDCTPEEALIRLLDGRLGYEFAPPRGLVVTLPALLPLCQPELGAHAPLPPCRRRT